MKYKIIKDVIDLVEEFESEQNCSETYENNVNGFKQWIADNYIKQDIEEPCWERKEYGRSAESIINTQIVHMNRYAKSYTKSALFNSDFATQEDIIYLINLNSYGEMTKTELIRKNVHEKPAGVQIINRLIKQGFVIQSDSNTDKRSKHINITEKGKIALENQMSNIRQASKIVTANLTKEEKMELIRILNKLEEFHQSIYDKNIATEHLLNEAIKEIN
ncbi:MarR family winged helix-turn-helix transcriptional regulator [Chishuiella sp.]|uniref:MarR family winged helix-turn-helix transcriptional regulator n=1 Tax=Chishuiella sp. TaxID=1969467 RepID=UPI0028A6193F|nr:MarR family winged helix-turn-helix transcriptional regulator [Chishuiella sp.]